MTESPSDVDRILQLEATQLSRQREVDRVLTQSVLDPFSILGVPHTCTPTDIKLAYRNKSRLIHPDKTAHAQARDAFERLKRAETELMDDDKRKSILTMMQEARRELAAEWKREEKGEEFERAVVEKYKAIMVDIEWRKRQRLKQELAKEGAASAKEEEAAKERRKRKEADKAWEDSRDQRVSSWRDFQAGSSGKKSKKDGQSKKAKLAAAAAAKK
ncbi:DnaJ domain-containing protein [Coemansia aciculifera]|uniref:DnaJ domain-containing protein n=1 Tax=Coemansia aciculifera TaxID=417176 RepID=A0A9W8IXB8_9FUNG|nr:DnaJ domain-containing protein [Coemansia sp. S146]KAJ2868524.1 DnaJ domain-containing protein [Coemansia aciculifera]KAJ2877298.1 DnaJ domain-containing protein [Coemansia aciculifera]KAJ2880263.1 DnaJ domain-containing protein [Coemansia aciculifera]